MTSKAFAALNTKPSRKRQVFSNLKNNKKLKVNYAKDGNINEIHFSLNGTHFGYIRMPCSFDLTEGVFVQSRASGAVYIAERFRFNRRLDSKNV
jgi:hypothetical protein